MRKASVTGHSMVSTGRSLANGIGKVKQGFVWGRKRTENTGLFVDMGIFYFGEEV